VTVPPDAVRFAGDPVPADSPKTMNSTNARILSVVRALLAARPGPTPRMWMIANTTMRALAVSV